MTIKTEEPEVKEKSVVELQREAIEVAVGKQTETETEAEVKAEETETTEEQADGETDIEAKAEETEETIEASKETEAELEAEKEAATTQKQKDNIQRKIDREISKRKAAETERDQLKAKLAALEEDGKSTLTEEDVETRAEKKAAEKLALKEFNDTCQKLGAEGVKVDKDFQVKINEMAKEVKPIPGQMIGILGDLKNGGAVLAHLANNHDEYEDLVDLPPAKMGLRLAELAAKVAEASKPKGPAKSKAPAPIKPVDSNGRNGTVALRDDEPMSDWVAKRNQQLRERDERRRRGLM